jgi:uncharacterized repeat protein (TIGR03803 family)
VYRNSQPEDENRNLPANPPQGDLTMQRDKRSFTLGCLLKILTAVALCAGSAWASDSSVNVIYRFQGPTDGSNPASNMIADKAGNLYGTTEYGGAGGFYGTVFELSPPSVPGGPWTETTLYSFKNDGDGARPTGGLIFDASGNLYGTTSDSNAGGYGEIFRLSPPNPPGGAWTETVLYSFQGSTDGAYPEAGMLFDPAGNLYGATETSVFELSPPASQNGSWKFTALHDFVCCTSDGWDSLAGLARDHQGNLYGTTQWGGFYDSDYCAYLGCGTVFEVSPPGSPGGEWKEQVLYRFNQPVGGFYPFSGLTLDAAGNLYGTTYSGGNRAGGVAFQLSPPAESGGAWTETVIHNFAYSSTDGAVPLGTLLSDSAGNLYGTTEFGGNPCVFDSTRYGCGIAFRLTPPSVSGGAWSETILFFFKDQSISAKNPEASLMFDKDGKLLGTTTYGGYNICRGDQSDGCGTVFEIGR